MNHPDADMLDFAPGLLRVQQRQPLPLPRLVMGSLSSQASVSRARRPGQEPRQDVRRANPCRRAWREGLVVPLAFSLCLCRPANGELGVSAQPATPVAKKSTVVELADHVNVLDGFMDCSVNFWFDRQRHTLSGSGMALAVPAGAASLIDNGSYAIIKATGQFRGLPIEWLFAPTSSNLGAGYQYSVGLAADIETVRHRLTEAWGIEFVEGDAEGPDTGAQEVAYYANTRKLSIAAGARTDGHTSLNCRSNRGASE